MGREGTVVQYLLQTTLQTATILPVSPSRYRGPPGSRDLRSALRGSGADLLCLDFIGRYQQGDRRKHCVFILQFTSW